MNTTLSMNQCLNNTVSPFDNILSDLHKDGLYTHMPFIFNREILLFSIGLENKEYPGRDWKIGYINSSTNQWQLFDTGLPDGTIECSPTAYFDHTHNRIVVCFLASTPTNPSYRMYRLFGQSFDTLSKAFDGGIVSYHGFINNSLFVRSKFQSNDDIHIYIQKRSGELKTLVAINQYVHKISYLAEEENTILVSLQKKENPRHAKEILIDTNDFSECKILKADGHKLYKTSIFEDFALYGKKLTGFDNRRIVSTNSIHTKSEPLKNHLHAMPR